jgi:BirA family biotin operon repressor/biotin-[acetyl-CoA-carboxylase] ligase
MIRHYPALGSTQDAARACVLAGERHVIGVRADYQSAGRGRRGARWIAPPGTCLLVTYILYGEDCRPERAGRLAFVAAVAVAEAIEAQTGLFPTLKWPNDVLLSGRKAAGILIETVPEAGAALAGIGMNVNVEVFPEDLAQTATSLCIEAGRAFDIAGMEEAVRRALFAARALEWEEALRRWRLWDATTGQRFRAILGGQESVGTAEGVSDSGALVMKREDGTVCEVLSATREAE